MPEHISRLFDFKIITLGHNPLTTGEIVAALLTLLIGILAAKLIFRYVGKRLLAKAHIKKNTALAITKILTYLAYVAVVLLAIRMVNIPLTTFAFLGGIIAIGVGFGAQNIISNFISGFIIMAERPINIGDLIEVDGLLGQVEEIGARCTRVRTGENIHMLVPNSAFLEKNITNWTLSDKKIRTKIVVGVIYGSPVKTVVAMLLKATMENKRIERNPGPFVLFADFGDNALIFEVYFWISIRTIIERKTIESTVRFRIDELFREAGLVIAFPQRDVHFDVKEPLKFRLVDDKDLPLSRPIGFKDQEGG